MRMNLPGGSSLSAPIQSTTTSYVLDHRLIRWYGNSHGQMNYLSCCADTSLPLISFSFQHVSSVVLPTACFPKSGLNSLLLHQDHCFLLDTHVVGIYTHTEQIMEASKKHGIADPNAATQADMDRDAPCLSHLAALNETGLLLYTKSSPSFDDLRGGYTLVHGDKPLAIARCLSIASLQTALRSVEEFRTAQGEQSLPFSVVVRSGGHDPFGRSAGPNSLLIDLRGLNSIEIAGDRRSAILGGGVTLGQASKFIEEHGLTTTPGDCNTVGFVGFATGGGYNLANGVYGLGVDQILGAKLVTASGAIVDTDEDKELLWAIRGAGTGNFGVVAELRIKTYDRPAVLSGLVVFSASEAEKVLNGLEDIIAAEGLPDNFNAEFVTVNMPGIGPTVAFLFAWTEPSPSQSEPLARGREWLQKIESLGTVLINTVAESLC
jgi:hypothetical protein